MLWISQATATNGTTVCRNTFNEVASWRKTTSKPFDLAVRALSNVGSSRLTGNER